MKQKSLFGVLTVGVTLGVGGSAQAALVVSDSFENSVIGDDAAGVYTTGSIIGQDADTLGFNADVPWALGSGASTSLAQPAGLSLSGVASSGGSVLFTQTGGSGTGSSATSRGLDAGLTGGSQLFFSFLIQRSDVVNTGRTEVNFTRNGTDGGGGPVSLGLTGDEMTLLYRTSGGGNSTLTTSDNLLPATTYFLTLELNTDAGTGGDDQLIARIFDGSSPITIGNELASLTASDADVFNATDGSLGAIQPRTAGGYTTGATWSYDEIRVGTTFADVVPAPASLALVGLGGLSLLGRSRRS